MKRYGFWIFIFLMFPGVYIYTQDGRFHFFTEGIAGYTTPGYVPFWLRSDQYGSIPPDGASLGVTGRISRNYDLRKKHLLDWGISLEARGNAGNRSNLKLIEGYGKIRLSIFELMGGREKQVAGICDTLLTSGSFGMAGNALGIPKVQLSVPDYQTLPFSGKMFAFKGSFAHGWIGETLQRQFLYSRQISLNTYFHQLSFYGRFGKQPWRMKFYGGFNHQVFWGNENEFNFGFHTLTPFETYLYVITGKSYGTDVIAFSRIGNHVGSIDVAAEYRFDGFSVFVYRQNFYDIGALYHLANIRDGLNGISFHNDSKRSGKFKWEKILVELLYTKNQAGESWSQVTPSGDEDYYNNDQFVTGYTYLGRGIGNPFLGDRTSLRSELPTDPRDYIVNNRVILLHAGLKGSFQKIDFLAKASFSLNYGTYGTSVEGHSIGTVHTPPQYGIFPETREFSGFINISRVLKDIRRGLTGALDTGGLYYNSAGLLLSAAKSF